MGTGRPWQKERDRRQCPWPLLAGIAARRNLSQGGEVVCGKHRPKVRSQGCTTWGTVILKPPLARGCASVDEKTEHTGLSRGYRVMWRRQRKVVRGLEKRHLQAHGTLNLFALSEVARARIRTKSRECKKRRFRGFLEGVLADQRKGTRRPRHP